MSNSKSSNNGFASESNWMFEISLKIQAVCMVASVCVWVCLSCWVRGYVLLICKSNVVSLLSKLFQHGLWASCLSSCSFLTHFSLPLSLYSRIMMTKSILGEDKSLFCIFDSLMRIDEEFWLFDPNVSNVWFRLVVLTWLQLHPSIGPSK